MNMIPLDTQDKKQEQCKYNAIDMALYLLHKMSPEAETEFKAHVENCESCRNKLADIERKAQNMKKEFQAEQRQIKLKRNYLALKIIAAIFILGIGMYFLFFQSSNPLPEVNQPRTYLQTDTLQAESDSIIKLDK